MGGNPGGGGGDASPHDFEGGGHNIKCPPPPHVFVVGRFFVEKLGFLTKFVYLFFFLLVRMSESDRRVLLSTQMALRKKVSESPPPPPDWVVNFHCHEISSLHRRSELFTRFFFGEFSLFISPYHGNNTKETVLNAHSYIMFKVTEMKVLNDWIQEGDIHPKWNHLGASVNPWTLWWTYAALYIDNY